MEVARISLRWYACTIDILSIQNLSFCHLLGDNALIAIGKNLKKLKKIFIAELEEITDAGVQALIQDAHLTDLQVKSCSLITGWFFHEQH